MSLSKNSTSSSWAKTFALEEEVLSKKIRPHISQNKIFERTNFKEDGFAKREKAQKSTKPSFSLDQKGEMRVALFTALINSVDLKAIAQLEPKEARDELWDVLSQFLRSSKVSLSLAEFKDLLEEICNHVLGYGPLEPLLARTDITHIIVNGPYSTFVEVDGKIEKTSVSFKNTNHLLNICRRIMKQVGLGYAVSHPLSDLRMSDGSRVNVVLPPLSVEGPALTIHRAAQLRLGFDQLIKIGALSQEARSLLETLRCAHTNILIAGGRSSGKTTLVNCLVEGINKEDRVIVCGDAVGFNPRRPHIQYFEARPQNFNGEGQITMRDLVKNSLRLRPQHVVVDELRGPEAFDLLQAFVEGQEGTIATVLAYSPLEALERIEDMILTSGCGLARKDIREQVCRLFPIIVQTSQLSDGSRKVTEIRQVVGVENNAIEFKKLFSFASNGDFSIQSGPSCSEERLSSADMG